MVAAFALPGCATSTPAGGKAPTSVRERMGQPMGAAVNPQAQRDYKRALAAMKADQDKKAERMLLALTRKYPELAGPNANLGILYQRMNRQEDAEAALRKAVALSPGNAAYYNQLGILYRSQGKFKKARRAYEKAIRLDPGYLYARLNLGILFDLYLRDPKQALFHYQQYQLLLPKEDKQVSKWIIDLRRRTQTADKKAGEGNG
jgi:Flp pilus assembly protein TadD